MDLDQYQKAWKADSEQMHVTIDSDQITQEVQSSQQNFQSTILWRDVREAGTSLVLIPIWIVMGITMALPWTWYLTIAALIFIVGFILVDRRRYPQRPSEAGETLLYYVKESLTQVEHQIWLLRNVFWWYLLPLGTSIMVFFAHVAWQSSSVWWEFVVFVGFLGLFLLVIYAGVYWMNQRAVRDQLQPRRQDLLRLIANLEADDSPESSAGTIDLVSALSNPLGNPGLSYTWESWAENWNLIVPSWRIAALIIAPTLIGAYCGLRYPLPEMGPVFFQSVVAAVIPFEIVFFSVWLWSSRQKVRSASANHGRTASSNIVAEDAVAETRRRLPRAPAIVILVLTLALGTLAVLAVLSFLSFGGALTPLDTSREPVEPDFGVVSELGEEEIATIDHWLQEQFELAQYPSLTVAIVRNGEIAHEAAFGFENIESGKEATLQTQYHVASVTKAFTASLAAMLHEQGVVDLDQPVLKYLPKAVSISTTPELGAAITLRQLASHTSGLPRGVPGRVQSAEGWYALEPQRLYNHLKRVKLESDPGADELYSNLGFGLLGHALECATEKSLDGLLQEMLAGPLSLERTAIQMDDTLHPATGYDASGWHWETTHSYRERLAGSGGLVTSVEDLAKFLIAQMEPDVLTRETLEQLHSRTTLSSGILCRTGLGWTIRFNPFLGSIPEKNGGRSNCSAWIGCVPEQRVGVVVVTNCGGPKVERIGRWLLERSVPGAYRPVAKYGHARVAPFSGIRWENDQPIVDVGGRWASLHSIDGIPIERIMEFARQEFGEKAHKRFAEDLVELLAKMGHDLDWEVTLELETEPGLVEKLLVKMTEGNRNLVRQ
ncbi:serine hydrolase domain-containing protein [Aureliella helgolandensis]|uniref:D-alanyl-D-alanine-carboxypeptidase/endopeptidase AmpH n=1 Tax=Aureliella helgolandensis TaxID=2527968 RepID=A0A518GA95_9BACT|nr:serine hydrolase domain-containing protein [Aureliella helgolandensis]QDV25528.1 D-alanyl-D-alanine-carboxypeptidase/endopeptidase AmpH precursor [Aureliella helgolandensis]